MSTSLLRSIERSAVALLVAFTIPTTPLLSQTCNGVASFGAGNVRIGGEVAFDEGANAFAFELAAGADRGLYGRAYMMLVDYDESANEGTGYGLGVGYGLSLNPRRTVELCPDAVVDRQLSPEFDTGIGRAQITGTNFALGFRLGGIASSSPSFDFVPYGSAHFASSKATLKFAGTTQSSTENFLALTGGAGFVFNKTITLRPSISFPVGLEDSNAVFSIALSVNLGKRVARARKRMG